MATKRKIGVLLSEKDLKKRYPESGIASEICLDEDRTLKLPCRVLSINHHIGGGLSYGKVFELGGEESTGKTLLAMDFGVVAQSMNGVVLWDDAESTFDPKWARAHGLDLKKVQILPFENEIELVSDWMADMCIYWRNKLTHNEPILLVVDSLALMEAGDALDVAEMDTKAEMGKRSFKMGSLLRKRTKIFAKYGIIVLLINQIRKKVGASKFEDPDTSPLAQVMKYYAAQRLFLYRGKRIRTSEDKKGKWVGNVVHVRTKKSKTSAPRGNVQAEVYFTPWNDKFGYDKYFGLADVLIELGVVTRKQARFYMKVKKKGQPAKTVEIAYGEKAFAKKITYDAELRKKLLRKAGISTPSSFREQLESIKYNLYPVKLKTTKHQEDNDEDGDEE